MPSSSLVTVGTYVVQAVVCLNSYLIGMTQPMITAARMIAHKSINGRYQSLMQMDQMEHLGQYAKRLPLSQIDD